LNISFQIFIIGKRLSSVDVSLSCLLVKHDLLLATPSRAVDRNVQIVSIFILNRAFDWVSCLKTHLLHLHLSLQANLFLINVIYDSPELRWIIESSFSIDFFIYESHNCSDFVNVEIAQLIIERFPDFLSRLTLENQINIICSNNFINEVKVNLFFFKLCDEKVWVLLISEFFSFKIFHRSVFIEAALLIEVLVHLLLITVECGHFLKQVALMDCQTDMNFTITLCISHFIKFFCGIFIRRNIN